MFCACSRCSTKALSVISISTRFKNAKASAPSRTCRGSARSRGKCRETPKASRCGSGSDLAEETKALSINMAVRCRSSLPTLLWG